MIWMVSQRILRPVSHTNARRRGGSLRMSRVSPGARVLKSPASTWNPCWWRAMPAAPRAARARAGARSSWSAPRSGARRRCGQRLARGDDLQEGAAAGPRPVPLVVRDFRAAHEPHRVRRARRPRPACPSAAASRSTTSGRVASCSTTTSGAHCVDHGGERALAARAAVADVVGEQPQRQALSTLPTSVR